MYETHALFEKQLYLSTFFKSYTLFWIPAVKIHTAGRASGGCMYGFKKECQKRYNLKFVEISSQVVLCATFEKTLFHFIPKYLNCTKWKTDFDEFATFLNEMNNCNFCIMGDLNARTGIDQTIDMNQLEHIFNINSMRNSKDKTINANGKRLLEVLENIGGVILNGRTVCDTVGDYTFCGVMGNSVIDYCVGSCSFLQYVDSLSVASKPYSDHMPLCLKLKVPLDSSANNSDPKFIKLHWNDKYAVQFRENLLSNPLHLDFQNSTDSLISSISSKIIDANSHKPNKSLFTPKQKWFNWKCYRLRSVMIRKLKDFRKQHTSANRNRYNSAKHRFLNYCDQRKLVFYNENLSQLETVKCSKQWWKISKSMQTKPIRPNITLDANTFSQHFNTLLNRTETQAISWCMPYSMDPFLDAPFQFSEVLAVIKSLKLNKSPGPDGIPYEFYKYSPLNFLSELFTIFNYIFLHEKVPRSFTKSIIVPLFKKGDPNIVTNYRGLSLMNANCKIFNNILLNRITDWLDRKNVLNEFQAGFRKDYSTIDNIFNLVNSVKLHAMSSKYTFAFFVDFSCAFDTIPRNSLFYKLASSGMSAKMIRIIQALYKECSSKVWDGSSFSDEFNVDCGVKQGCILSPILFSIYLNDLPDVLSGGINVAGTIVKILLYADDIVLLSDSGTALQTMIDNLYSYCMKWSLKVNLDKSKIMIFRNHSRAPQCYDWKYGNQHIDIVNNYTYLGVNISYNLSFKKHLENKLSSSKMAISSTWSKYIANPKISHKNKLKIFNAAARSIMLYGSQIWGYERYDSVEKLFRYFIKKMFILPSNTPNYVLYLETSYETLFITTIKLHFSYINRILALNSNRLPKILAEKVISLNTFWAYEWTSLCTKIGFFPPNNLLPISHYCSEILELVKNSDLTTFTSDAANSQYHDLYPKLNFNVSNMLNDLSPRATSLIIKARCGLLDINAKCFKANTFGYCTICNLDMAENTLHFIGVCPVYANIRKRYLGRDSLNIQEVISHLNGKNFNCLYFFIENALKYRYLILNEYTF